MSSICYEQLALDWSPVSKSNRRFNIIALLVVFIMMLSGLIMSSIPVPEEKREARYAVPERIANFIIEKKKPEPKKVTPKPKPKPEPKPRPLPKPVPKVKKTPKEKAPKPLTKSQKKAREKAAESGLLALGSELADLMDTDDINTMIGGEVKSASTSASTAAAASQGKALLTADAGKGSSGINEVEYTAVVGKSQLSQREITQVKQSLLSAEAQAKSSGNKRSGSRSGGVRAEEDISIVFDQNKSRLYSIYNRARRTNPGLKGRIVLEITISPSGKVTNIKIVSSELGDSKLESRLVNRIKLFDFGAMKVEQVIVTYPIEFLPS